jgi:hypothetical protein
MTQPFRCPVCLGRGMMPQGFYDCNDTSVPTCRSCNGKGFVWEPGAERPHLSSDYVYIGHMVDPPNPPQTTIGGR